jgi:hypothetical protein
MKCSFCGKELAEEDVYAYSTDGKIACNPLETL